MKTWKRGEGSVAVATRSGATYEVSNEGKIVRNPGTSGNTIDCIGLVWEIEVGSIMQMVRERDGHRIYSTQVEKIESI